MTSSSEDGNRGNGAQHTTVDTITLTYSRAQDQMNIGGNCQSLDLMLDMLARATRTIEAQYRKTKAVETALAIQEAQHGAEIARRIGMKG